MHLRTLNLYVAPHTCSIVPAIGLEEVGVEFDTTLIRLAKNEQSSDEYLAINPKGKVPTLVVDGTALAENAAILNWLNEAYPDADLLPKAPGEFERQRQLADLFYFSSTVHPSVARYAIPFRFVRDQTLAMSEVRPVAQDVLSGVFRHIDQRLKQGPWWYGERWSIIDGYLFWTWTRATIVGFPKTEFPNLVRHHELSMKRPAVQRAMERQAADIETLEAEGIYKAPI